MLNTRVESTWLLTGLLSLILGALVYVVDRDPATVYFISDKFSLFQSKPGVFGQAGYYLPTFLHCFALILLSAAVTGSERVSVLSVSLAWLIIESVFEIAQAQIFSHLIAASVPGWFASVPILENTSDYFLHGNFDVNDLLSIIAGCTVAYILLQLTIRSSSNESIEKYTK